MDFINSNLEQLKKLEGFDILELNYSKPIDEKLSKAVILREDNIYKGFGIAWYEKLHPFRQNIYIKVFKPYRKRGLGTRIFNYMTTNIAMGNLRCEIDAGNIEAINFLKKFEFFMIKKKAKYKFSTEDLSTVFIPYGDEPKLMKISELTEESRDVLYSMLLIDYNRINKSNPTDISLSFENWKANITKDLLYWDSFFDFREGSIYSYLLSYKSKERDTVLLKYTSATRRDMRYGKFLAQACRNLFRNYKYIEIEFDSKDLSKDELKKIFKLKKKNSKHIYIKNY
ncbi:MAG: hypothetical protein Q4P29_03435 [Tissierellia bacterium]|nr:hypothetical protein [Tissierellia bacterium]